MTLNLNELKRLAEEATPGEWWSSGMEVGNVPMMNVKVAKVSGSNAEEAKANASFIAAATPPTILDLIARIEEAETRNALQQRALDEASKGAGSQIPDTARLDWMAAEECHIESLTLLSGTRYRIRWTNLDEAQGDWFATPRAAIDASIKPTANGAGGQG